MIDGMFEGVNNTPVVEKFKKQLFEKAFKPQKVWMTGWTIRKYAWH
jgi:hypothetical protein